MKIKMFGLVFADCTIRHPIPRLDLSIGERNSTPVHLPMVVDRLNKIYAKVARNSAPTLHILPRG
jgi:hypothetical protein